MIKQTKEKMNDITLGDTFMGQLHVEDESESSHMTRKGNFLGNASFLIQFMTENGS